jgi:unsaturated chondroitin disaccharide hydrolase
MTGEFSMTLAAWSREAIDTAINRVRAIAAAVTDFPHITEDGVWQTTPDGVWTGGFWAGLLWLCHDYAGDAESRARAIHFTDRLLPRAFDATNHDLGFMFVPSAVAAWRVTRDARYRLAALAAAQSLAAQYNGKAGYIPGWGFFGGDDWRGKVLIDTLMNLPLLVWAVDQGADPRLLDVVKGHTATTLTYLMRPDGSVYHMFRFDPLTGTPVGGDTYQGHAPESAWSRGQAWALTALALLGARMGEPGYLAASERVADYFLKALPADGVPPWDFLAPGPDEPKDASAGAIASYGLLKLYEATGRRRYFEAAGRQLQALAETCANRGERGGLLLHATADLPHGHGIDGSVVYGDYYYLKALLRLGRAG